MGRAMQTRRAMRILVPYCKKIRNNGKHYTCYFKESNAMITFAITPSDVNWNKNLHLQIRRYTGLDIKELLQL